MQVLRKSKGCDFRESWILDSETDGLGKPGGKPEVLLCVVFHVLYGYIDFWGNHAIENALKYIISKGGGDVYAHNGGRFDFRLVYKWLLDHGAKGSLIFSGSTVLIADFEIDGVRLTLCDSYRLLPSALWKIGKSLGYPKLEWNHDTTKETIKTVEGQLRFLEYCKRDCEILYKGLVRFQAAIEPHGIGPRRTLASTCTSLARYRLKTAPKVSEALEEIAIKCVFGGRTEVHDYSTLKEGFAYDRHQSYPASALSGQVPWNFETSSKSLNLNRPGFATCTVKVEECNIPILPCKFKEQPGRVFFATGLMEGTWTIEELRFAVEMKQAEIISVEKSYYFDESDFLQEFVRWGLNQRQKAIENGDEFGKNHWKLFNNSFIGKLIEKTKKMSATFGIPKDLLFKHEIEIGGQSIFLVETNYMPPFRHACAGGTILARARIALWKYLQQAKVWYMDTDSMHTDVANLPIGPDPGDWGFEVIRNARYLAPKFYDYEVYENNEWKKVVKSKGMPTTVEAFEALRRGESVKVHRTRGFREAIKVNRDVDYQATEVFKKLNPHVFPKRKRMENGTTRPWTVEEIKARVV